MNRKLVATLGAAALIGIGAASISWTGAGAATSPSGGSSYEPVLDPANFVGVIDNRYFPLPVGRVLVYTGTKDGQTQVDTVTVTNQTKVVEGITARIVSDVATHDGTLLEKTFDWYAQDKQGNVWYLGEDTKAYLPNGKVDTSGSWESGVNDAEPARIIAINARPVRFIRFSLQRTFDLCWTAPL